MSAPDREPGHSHEEGKFNLSAWALRPVSYTHLTLPTTPYV